MCEIAWFVCIRVEIPLKCSFIHSFAFADKIFFCKINLAQVIYHLYIYLYSFVPKTQVFILLILFILFIFFLFDIFLSLFD